MSSIATTPPGRFDWGTVESFHFTDRTIDLDGTVTLGYAFDDGHEFEERFTLPQPPKPAALDSPQIQGLLALLHFTAGVSYYKAAIPARIVFDHDAPGPATLALLAALYSEGLGEFATVNRLAHLPRPHFLPADASARGRSRWTTPGPDRPAPPAGHASAATPDPTPTRVLVPVGGGKDSAVALEIVRASGLPMALFSVGDTGPIAGTAKAAGIDKLTVIRKLDPRLIELNGLGALNGHVPITAIVSSVAALTAALHGYDAVTLANERSASAGNTIFDGVEVNHQFSKSLRAEELLAAAVGEIPAAPFVFSILRPASELSIARAFARLPQYHHVFTSCNRIFQIDPAKRLTSWCCDCDKCRFVFLILAPFIAPDELKSIFGAAMLDDESQYDGFALLTATGGHKPFECVGEVSDSVAALRLIAADERWRERPVAKRLIEEVLPLFGADEGRPEDVFKLSTEHHIPPTLFASATAMLGV